MICIILDLTAIVTSNVFYLDTLENNVYLAIVRWNIP